tara:strand:- start:1495 stop:1890 length:396 start_codon:yes stop_codon:yes gene_type:complete
LWIHGPPGIGNFHAAYSIIGNLLGFTKDERRSSVAYYLFKEDNDVFRQARDMFQAAAIHDISFLKRWFLPSRAELVSIASSKSPRMSTITSPSQGKSEATDVEHAQKLMPFKDRTLETPTTDLKSLNGDSE